MTQLRLKYLEEHGDAVELELDPGGVLVLAALWEAVLQGRGQRDEGHGAVEWIRVDKDLQRQENFIDTDSETKFQQIQNQTV